MKPISFLTEEEIQKMQEAEANSSKEQKKTAEQIEAIYTAGQNILVSASAGSGKTFVMAERILDQLARGVEISQLFISTFTVKAASELKERLEKKISQQIQETDDVDLKQHLGRQLADLPNAAIGTMDSFTQKFLGKHGYLIDIAPNFRILQNESEQLLLKNEVFHQVLHKDCFRREPPDYVHQTTKCTLFGQKKKLVTALDHIEYQANTCAADFLMPRKTVPTVWRSISGFDRPAHEDYRTEDYIRKIAQVYQVSRQAMRYRLRNLQLIVPPTTAYLT